MHRELIRVAKALIDTGGRGRILQARRARATSSAYYALFHRLSAHCAAETIGWSHRRSDAFRRVYRSLDHGRTKSAFEDLAKPAATSDTLRLIAQTFIYLQKQRHLADYDFTFDASKNEVADLIDRAKQAIDAVDLQLTEDEKRTLLARLIGGRVRAS